MSSITISHNTDRGIIIQWTIPTAPGFGFYRWRHPTRPEGCWYIGLKLWRRELCLWFVNERGENP